jgi:threonine/homoserine/homoserine lactone efflux protein
MIERATLITYVLAVLGLFLIPGPANLLVLARASSSGRRVGVASGLGIVAGDVIHTAMATLGLSVVTAMASLGLSVVLMTSAAAFTVVKYVGAAYLIYLGVRAIFEKAQAMDLPTAQAADASRAFRQAILIEALNPKTALFFLSFLPQFVRPENGRVVLQFAALGFIFVALSAAWTSMVAVAAGSFGRWLRRHRGIGRWQGKVVGSIYIGLGVRLALQER